MPSTVNWCTVTPNKGNASPNITVKVKVTENKEYDERNATLTFRCELNTVTHVISQKQKDALLVSSSRVEMDADGGSFDIEVQSNVQVTCEIPAQYGGWLKAAPDSRGLTAKGYTFTVAANDGNESRKGEVIFKYGLMREVVEVYQYFGNTLILGTHEAMISAGGGRIDVGVRSNVEFAYSVTEGSEWIHPVESRALSSHTVYFDIDAYTDLENDRIGTVTFTSTDGKLSEKLTVTQRYQGAVIVNTESIEADYAGGTYRLELSANCEVKVSGPSEWVRMGELLLSRGMNTYVQEIIVAPNYYEKERRCNLIVSSKEDKNISATVEIVQGPLEYEVETNLPQGAYEDARSHEFYIKVNTRAPYELMVSSDRLVDLGDGWFRLNANRSKGVSGIETIDVRVAGQHVKAVDVKYDAPATPSVSQDTYYVSGQAEKIKITVNNNTDIECSVPSDASGWLVLSESSIAENGFANDVWIFDVAENGSEAVRSASITLSAGNMWLQTVNVVQDKVRTAENTATATLDGSKTLEEVLSETSGGDIYTIEALDVYGGVSAADVSTVRSMATEGKLVELDMSRSELKKDDKPYCWPANSEGGFITADNVVGDYMFYKTNLAQVKLPDAAISVGKQAFYESKVEVVEFGPNVKSIGWQCFKNCDKLRKVNIPDPVEEIPEYCFFGTYELTEITLGRGLKRIGNRALCPIDCYNIRPSKLTSIILPDGLEEIGFKAMCSTGITTMTIPSSVKRIEPYAFYECRSLHSIKFENEMDTLPAHILENTIGLREIVFPRGLKVIGESAFAGTDIEYLTVPEGVVELMSTSLSSAGRKGCVLPQSLEIIGPRALCWRSQCYEFTIPKNVKKIGNKAFMGTWSVKQLHIQCPTPPQCDGDIFTASVAQCTLFVPAGTADVYRQTAPWSGFKEIVEE